ncbi:MAG: GNAT family N-acetyltransferase [Gammaproteobacteria bacterium]|nr:GNAT family N-acetyltransferase [Gammaproteobacteria bacterium]NNJ83789.1 GNAT family N-acetyltransferase [Gammaproteobacteria bacterium]
MIEPLASSHVEAITRLHFDSLTGLLGNLGPRAIRAFYQGAIGSRYAIGFVDIEKGYIGGFVFGSTNPGCLKQALLKRRFIATTVGVCLGVLRRPSTLASLCESALPRQQGYGASEPELTYLAVDERQRSGGIGRQLVEHFSQALGERGILAYELSADADNHGAIDFYHRLGFLPIGQYTEFGIIRNRYRIELS